MEGPAGGIGTLLRKIKRCSIRQVQPRSERTGFPTSQNNASNCWIQTQLCKDWREGHEKVIIHGIQFVITIKFNESNTKFANKTRIDADSSCRR